MGMDAEGNETDERSTQSAVSYDSRTLRLLELLSENSEDLANMLRGAWITLESSGNPDVLAQVAHSMRELMEKAHDYMVEVPVKIEGNGLKSAVISLTEKWTTAIQGTKSISTSDWSGTVDNPFQKVLKALGEFFTTFSVEHKPRSAQHKAVLTTLDGSGQPIPEAITKERLKLWGELDDFFKGVAHHQTMTTKAELKAKIVTLEDFILDIKYPERSVPIDTLDLLDGIIAEGDSV
jgi:hypothetical protein